MKTRIIEDNGLARIQIKKWYGWKNESYDLEVPPSNYWVFGHGGAPEYRRTYEQAKAIIEYNESLKVLREQYERESERARWFDIFEAESPWKEKYDELNYKCLNKCGLPALNPTTKRITRNKYK